MIATSPRGGCGMRVSGFTGEAFINIYSTLTWHPGEQLCSYSACVHVSCTFDRLNRCWEGRRTLPYGGARIAKGASMSTDAAKAVVRRNTEEVQSRGNFDVFEELFAVDFVDHTPQPNSTPDRDGARSRYRRLRAAFPDFHADIHWQAADGELVTTYKTYHGTHQGTFLGVAPTGRKIQFETVDVMRVRNGKITEHWGVANLFALMQQLGPFNPEPQGTGREETPSSSTPPRRSSGLRRSLSPTSRSSGADAEAQGAMGRPLCLIQPLGASPTATRASAPKKESHERCCPGPGAVRLRGPLRLRAGGANRSTDSRRAGSARRRSARRRGADEPGARARCRAPGVVPTGPRLARARPAPRQSSPRSRLSHLPRAGLLRPPDREPVHPAWPEGVVDRQILPRAEPDRLDARRDGRRRPTPVHRARRRGRAHLGRRLDGSGLRLQRCAGARRHAGRAPRQFRAPHRRGGPRVVHRLQVLP